MKHCTLLLACAVVPLSGCGGAATEPEARPVAEWVLENGGSVTLEETGRTADALDELPEGGFALRRIAFDDLQGPPLRDEILEKLSRLEYLEYLGLYGAPVADRQVDFLTKITSLQELELSYTDVTAEGLRKLKSLPDLEKLYIHGVPLSPEELESLRSDLPDCQVYH